jgi:hypothetical protein
LKIFISYSRKDGSHLADDVARRFKSISSPLGPKFDVFTDIDNITAGSVWTDTIATNISNSDIFVLIITFGAERDRTNMENELKQAQGKKVWKIIPCLHKDLEKFGQRFDKTLESWGLNGIQGVEFDNGNDLANELEFRILQIMNYKVGYDPQGWANALEGRYDDQRPADGWTKWDPEAK